VSRDLTEKTLQQLVVSQKLSCQHGSTRMMGRKPFLFLLFMGLAFVVQFLFYFIFYFLNTIFVGDTGQLSAPKENSPEENHRQDS